jgi:hypothetical protein
VDRTLKDELYSKLLALQRPHTAQADPFYDEKQETGVSIARSISLITPRTLLPGARSSTQPPPLPPRKKQPPKQPLTASSTIIEQGRKGKPQLLTCRHYEFKY